MSLRTARPGPLQIRIDRAVGARALRGCPAPNPQRRFSGRFRTVATLDEPAARPAAAAATVARRLTLKLRLYPRPVPHHASAPSSTTTGSHAPLRRYLRVLG